MENKRLAEQNMRFLNALYAETTTFTNAVVDEMSRCDRDAPSVNWDRFPFLRKRMDAMIEIGTSRQADDLKKKGAPQC